MIEIQKRDGKWVLLLNEIQLCRPLNWDELERLRWQVETAIELERRETHQPRSVSMHHTQSLT